jgi:hypothetical protein
VCDAFFLTPFLLSCVLIVDMLQLVCFSQENTKQKTTLSDGYLGSRNDEERSEMRYVMRIAELSESSNL